MSNIAPLAAILVLLALLPPAGAFLCPPSSSPTPSSSSRLSVAASSSLVTAYIDEGRPHTPREEAPVTQATNIADANGNTSSNTGDDENEKAPESPARRTKPPKVLPNGGTLALVGAGPGDPDLLTVAAHRIISDPDSYVIVDRLVSQEILDLIQGEYKVANKHPGCQHVAQEEIFGWCKEGLERGRRVVRLKIGDPFVFGRGGEEVLEFREFGVEPTVIPGVSAAFSAPLLGSIPVTHRGVSNQVVMCTGYGRDGTSPSLIQYHEEQTVVFLMAVGRLRTLCANLVSKAHYPEDTPVGVVERAGCPDQRTVVGTVGTIADLAEEHDVRPPSTIVVGEVVNVLLTEEDFGEEVRSARQQGLVQSV